MPCIPLVITSACFIVPSVIAFIKRRRVDGVATCALACTSLWFHGSSAFIAYVIDKTYAHAFAVTYMGKAVLRCVSLHRVCDFAVVALGIGSIHCYLREGETLHVPLHSLVHLCSIAAFSLHMLTIDVEQSGLDKCISATTPQ